MTVPGAGSNAPGRDGWGGIGTTGIVVVLSILTICVIFQPADVHRCPVSHAVSYQSSLIGVSFSSPGLHDASPTSAPVLGAGQFESARGVSVDGMAGFELSSSGCRPAASVESWVVSSLGAHSWMARTLRSFIGFRRLRFPIAVGDGWLAPWVRVQKEHGLSEHSCCVSDWLGFGHR